MKKKIIGASLSVLALALSASAVFFGNNKKMTPAKATGKDSYWASWIESNKGYINSGGSTLLTKLQNKINSNTTRVTYAGLWDAYKTTDTVPGYNGAYIWDTYGGFKYSFQSSGSDIVNSGVVGGGYNREHSVPKSWFGSPAESTVPYSDLFHLMPTDCKVNQERSNYAFGEVSSGTSWTIEQRTDKNGNVYQTAGYSKLGTPKAINGVTTSESKVFEPDDQFKGDFARNYMYFITRYGGGTYSPTEGAGAAIFSDTLTDANPYVTNYGLALLKKWHVQDPVSQKEIDRNNAVEALQNNRNPYIDYPEWADKIFHTNYEEVHGGGSSETPSISLSASSTTMEVGSSVTLTATPHNLSGTVLWYVEDFSTDVVTLSATSGTTITVDGISEGTKTIYAYIGEVSSSIDITVTNGGGGGSSTEETYSRLTSISSIDESAKYVLGLEGTGFHYSGTTSWGLVADPDNQTPLYYTLTKGAGNTTFTAKTIINSTDYYLTVPTSNTFTMSTSSSNIKLGTSDSMSGDYAYAVANTSTTGRHLRINGSNGLRSYNGNTGSMAYFYKVNEGTTTKTLSSISLDTESVTKTFNVNDVFSYTGLVVTAHYSDGSNATVTPSSVSSPDMTTSGQKTITVTYIEGGVTKTATYTITVNAQQVTSITATVNKNFYVGETISKSDITVKDNLNNTITDYTFESYRYTYADAASGGALTDKNFTITYSGLTTTLNTKVHRKAHVVPSPSTSVTDTLNREKTGISGTNYGSWSDKTDESSAVYAGQSAGGNDSIQLRSNNSNSGIITTTSGGKLSKVVVEWQSGTSAGRALNVYGKQSSYDSPSDLYVESDQGTLLGTIVKGTSTELTISGDYTYVGVRSDSGAMYLTSISFTWGESGVSDSANNLANYVMFEDTSKQCVDKFPTAKGYFEGLSKAERNTFMTSNDYVISTARERLVAWAAYHGKTITNSGDDGYVINSNKLSITAQNNAILLITIIGVVIISSLTVTYLVIKKRKQD